MRFAIYTFVGGVAALVHYLYKTLVFDEPDLQIVITDSLTVPGVLFAGIGGLWLIIDSGVFVGAGIAAKRFAATMLGDNSRIGRFDRKQQASKSRGTVMLVVGMLYLVAAFIGCIICSLA